MRMTTGSRSFRHPVLPALLLLALFLRPVVLRLVRVPFAHPTRFACPPLKAFSQIPRSDHPDVEALATHQLLLIIRARRRPRRVRRGSRYAIAGRTTLRPSISMVPRVVEQLVQLLRFDKFYNSKFN
jgi:hypothetical protein